VRAVRSWVSFAFKRDHSRDPALPNPDTVIYKFFIKFFWLLYLGKEDIELAKAYLIEVRRERRYQLPMPSSLTDFPSHQRRRAQLVTSNKMSRKNVDTKNNNKHSHSKSTPVVTRTERFSSKDTAIHALDLSQPDPERFEFEGHILDEAIPNFNLPESSTNPFVSDRLGLDEEELADGSTMLINEGNPIPPLNDHIARSPSQILRQTLPMYPPIWAQASCSCFCLRLD
jgi:hypothetical protein